MKKRILETAASLKKGLSGTMKSRWPGDLSGVDLAWLAVVIVVFFGGLRLGIEAQKARVRREAQKVETLAAARGEVEQAAQMPGVWGVCGPCSTFGGEKDATLSRSEGVALVSAGDSKTWWFKHLFTSEEKTGLAKGLNPSAFYVACRWDYSKTPRAVLRWSVARVSFGGRSVWARPVDWGPAERTGKSVDLSPGAARVLGVKTGEEVSVQIFP